MRRPKHVDVGFLGVGDRFPVASDGECVRDLGTLCILQSAFQITEILGLLVERRKDVADNEVAVDNSDGM
jgi:hypothetical protein